MQALEGLNKPDEKAGTNEKFSNSAKCGGGSVKALEGLIHPETEKLSNHAPRSGPSMRPKGAAVNVGHQNLSPARRPKRLTCTFENEAKRKRWRPPES